MEWSLFPNRHQLSAATISTISSVVLSALKQSLREKNQDELNIVFVLAMNKTEPQPQNFGHNIHTKSFIFLYINNFIELKGL